MSFYFYPRCSHGLNYRSSVQDAIYFRDLVSQIQGPISLAGTIYIQDGSLPDFTYSLRQVRPSAPIKGYAFDCPMLLFVSHLCEP